MRRKLGVLSDLFQCHTLSATAASAVPESPVPRPSLAGTQQQCLGFFVFPDRDKSSPSAYVLTRLSVVLTLYQRPCCPLWPPMTTLKFKTTPMRLPLTRRYQRATAAPQLQPSHRQRTRCHHHHHRDPRRQQQQQQQQQLSQARHQVATHRHQVLLLVRVRLPRHQRRRPRLERVRLRPSLWRPLDRRQ